MLKLTPQSLIMRYTILLALAFLFACQQEKPLNDHLDRQPTPTIELQKKQTYQFGQIYADNEYAGARLSDFKKINDSTFQALMLPENKPVNNSPWFGFRVWSEKETSIQLEIKYDEGFKNRYIPKVSRDGVNWNPLATSSYRIDTAQKNITLDLNLSSEKLWISAQENMNTAFINDWIDELLARPNIEEEVVGQSVMGKPIKLLKINTGKAKQSIILIGRQHPPEVPGGTISLMSFVNTLLSGSDLAKSFNEQFEILLFPLLNPDGVDEGTWRHNANGQDLNRDWVKFSQPETQAVRDWIKNSKTERAFRFGIDFHTSYSGPYLLTLDTLPHHSVQAVVTAEWIRTIEEMTGDTLDIRPRAQDLPYCYNWMINELNTEAVTYEEGDEIDRKLIKQRAENYANTLMGILLKEIDR